jgi:flagellar assembly factor FliW
MSIVTVESSRFGTLAIEAADVIEFPTGLIGLSSTRWALVGEITDGPFQWLHSLDDGGLALPVTSPWAFFADYEVDLSDTDSARIASGDVTVLVTVRAGSELSDFSANLRAPILISGGRGHQVINEAKHPPVRAALFPEAVAKTAAAEAAVPPAAQRAAPDLPYRSFPRRNLHAHHHPPPRREDHARRRDRRPRDGDRRQQRPRRHPGPALGAGLPRGDLERRARREPRRRRHDPRRAAPPERALSPARAGYRSRMPRKRLLLLGTAVVAAAVLLKRDKVAGLLPSRSETPYTPPSTGPSNYDAPGPVANTATPVPVPEAYEPPAIDEDAEEAAAAAEAANIGGVVSDYAGPEGLPADEAERPLAEAGEGESEGEEQAEFELEQAAEPTAPGMSDSERQIEQAIEDAANPLVGERLETVRPPDEPPAEAEERAQEESGWTPPSPDQPTEERPAEPDEGEGGSDWRTWSGRSINP